MKSVPRHDHTPPGPPLPPRGRRRPPRCRKRLRLQPRICIDQHFSGRLQGAIQCIQNIQSYAHGHQNFCRLLPPSGRGPLPSRGRNSEPWCFTVQAGWANKRNPKVPKLPTEARPPHANQRRHPALNERGRSLNQQRRQTVVMKVQKSHSTFLTLRLVKCLCGYPRRVVSTCEQGAIIPRRCYASAASVAAEDPRVDDGSEKLGRLLLGEFESGPSLGSSAPPDQATFGVRVVFVDDTRTLCTANST